MVMLSEFNTKKDTTEGMLDTLIQKQDRRTYLGCSSIGHDCDRFLWFQFRWAYTSEISATLKRLFKRGHREEPEIIYELEQIGIKCYEDQAECNFVEGHMSGHCDGKAIGVIEAPKTEHLLEFKTMNDKAFKEMQKKGVLESKPIYYAQLQVYMLGLDLTRALFICVNKNDDRYYIERVPFYKHFADEMIRKGHDIIVSKNPRQVMSPHSRTWFKCKWCDAYQVCFGQRKMEINCRTCVHAKTLKKAQWKCDVHGYILNKESQLKACECYEAIEI